MSSEENEIWRKSVVRGSERVDVSNFGNVRFPSGRITRGCRQEKKVDYFVRVVSIGPRDNQKNFKVHRLVCFAFHGETHREWLPCVDHKNQDSEDNHASNLKFTTNQLNQYNSSKHKGYRKRGNKFRTHIVYNKKHYSKSFDTEKEARDWYLAEREKFVKKAEAELQEIEELRTRLLSSLNCAS